MSRPRVAFVGWRLGGELEHAIRLGHERIDYTVVSMALDETVRPLVDWIRMPRPPRASFRLGWATFFSLAGLRLGRIDVDLVHAIGPLPVVPNRVDLNTVTFCQAAYAEATAGDPIKGSASAVGWQVGQRFAVGLERWWFRRGVRTLVAISEGSARDLRRLYPKVPVTILPRGVDLHRFSPDEADRRRFRLEHGVEPDAVVALFVDQQHRPLKGLDVAIQAFAAARQSSERPDLLWIVGAGGDRHAALAEALGVRDRVRFLGHTSEIERCYRAADIFLLPTVYETFCRAAHEAAACGLPIVAPGVHGIRELVGRDEAGIIARRDPAELARALVRLSPDPVRARMGAIGLERARAFDLERVARGAVALHESQLSRRPRGGRPA